MYDAGGKEWFFSLLGYAPVAGENGAVIIGGGLGYFLAFEIATFLAQCINFPLQRNITFRSHGNPAFQAMWYFIGWVLTSLFCNGVNSLWLPLATGAVSAPIPQFLTALITIVVMGGIAMIVFFFIFLVIFPDYEKVSKRKTKKLDGLKASHASAEKIAMATVDAEEAAVKAGLSSAEKAAIKAATKASSKALAYLALVNGNAKITSQPGYAGKVAAAQQSASEAIADKHATAEKFAELKTA
jgi:putative flippase GtrA